MIDILEEALYKMGLIINVQQFCWENGYWTRQYLKDDDGNILDYEDLITPKDLQAVSDLFELRIDCLNW